jgi:ATP synthase protein I
MAVFGIGSRPLRAALSWQLAATVLIASVAGIADGVHAALSAVLGGGVIIIANGAYALVVGSSALGSAGATIRIMLRAETVKIALIVVGLWLVFSLYRGVVPLPFIGSFVIAVLLWPVALLYKD